MNAPISWLQDFVKIDIPAEALADKLVHAGFEVEDIIRESDNIRNVVTGRVIATERHPNSDHLWICQVNVKTATLQIVTGAQNVKVNDIVPVALDGAQLPDGKRIYNGELRGVKSLGMLCGGSELGLTDDDYEGASVDGIMIMGYGETVNENGNSISNNIYDMMTEMEKAIENADIDRLGELTGNFKNQFDNMVSGLGEIGVRTKFLDTTLARLENENTTLLEAKNNVEATDDTTEITNFKGYQNSWNLILQFGGNIFPKSLMDYVG